MSEFNLNYHFTNKTISFYFSKIFHIYLLIPFDSTNDQNSMRRVTSGYIYTLKIQLDIKEKLETV